MEKTATSLTITKAGIGDIDTIRSITYAVWPRTYEHILTPEQITYMLDMMYSPASLKQQMKEGHHFILVKENEQCIAFASYAAYLPGVFKLHKIYALPDQHGKGIGKYIIQHIAAAIKPLGAHGLQLNINRFNKARGFYEKLGFTVIGEEDIDIGKGYFMNDYIMELAIV